MAFPSVSVGRSLLLIAAFAFASEYFYHIYYRKKRKHTSKEIYEVIMFSNDSKVLTESKHSKCMIPQSMDRLLYYLSTPRYSLDICMYMFTSQDIANAILVDYYRGIKVRMIMDAEMAFCSGSTMKSLDKSGVKIKLMQSTNSMHHNFAILDTLSEEAHVVPLLIGGSMNWTNQALHGNWENVIVTSRKEIVSQYRDEFERLWSKLSPNN